MKRDYRVRIGLWYRVRYLHLYWEDQPDLAIDPIESIENKLDFEEPWR